MITFKILGSVRAAETLVPLAGFWVKAYDKDLLFDDFLGASLVNELGEFEIATHSTDFRDFFELRPDVYLKVLAPDRQRHILSTDTTIRWQSGCKERFDILVPLRALGEHAKPVKVTLIGPDGDAREDFDVGEALSFAASGIQPAQVFSVRFEDEHGRELFTDRLLSNSYGAIEPTVVWPQVGLDDLTSTKRHSLAEAHRIWAGKRVQMRLLHQGRELARRELRFAFELSRPQVLSTDTDGRVLNGFELGSHAAIVRIHRAPFEGLARVYLVPRQHQWRPGDRFAPARLANHRRAFVDVRSERVGAEAAAVLAEPHELLAGAYDFIVRRLRYGYEDDDDFVLRKEDLVGGRRVTGLVIRKEFWGNKPIKGGCTNVFEIAARPLSGQPYVQFSNVFQTGEAVYAALDPALLDPAHTGKMAALYVVPHKTAAEWSIDDSLVNLAVLGGNAGVQQFLTQSACVNMNLRLLWPSALPGEYDVVADFGNGATSPSAFVSDAAYSMPADIIDGYLRVGFRVVDDPSTDTSFSHSGHLSYDETTAGYAAGNSTRPMRASVYFPADTSGVTGAAGLSSVQPNYPLIIVAHGSHTHATPSYLGFEYLLQHLALNGFIAASISAESAEDNPQATAEIIRAQAAYLTGVFGTHLQANIGLLGHSRGGEGVCLAAVSNHAIGWGLAINAVLALSPTDFYASALSGTWAPPLLVIYGSLDNDLKGIPNTGFKTYDHAAGAEKSFLMVYGATHNRFNTEWPDEHNPADAANVISALAHCNILQGYAAAFFRQHLRSETQFTGIFRGEWVPTLARNTDLKAKFYVQYQHPTALTIDDFEGTHTVASWETSSIGSPVSQASLLGDPIEDELGTLDAHSPHATAGVLLAWTASTGQLQFAVPAAQRDVTAYAAISFRVAQKVGSLWNTPGSGQDLRLQLTDGTGHSRAVLVSRFGEIPVPGPRAETSVIKSALRTLRVPLDAYTIRCLGIDAVDLTNITSVVFVFGTTASGEIEIDSVQFTL
jgi:hypothetical protein